MSWFSVARSNPKGMSRTVAAPWATVNSTRLAWSGSRSRKAPDSMASVTALAERAKARLAVGISAPSGAPGAKSGGKSAQTDYRHI